MNSNPMAEAFLGCLGGGEPGSKGRRLSTRRIGGHASRRAALAGPHASCEMFTSHLRFLGLRFLICKMGT